MEFRHPAGQHRAVILPRRSLLIMTGESRYLWTHGITPRKYDVVPAPDSPDSLTLIQREMRTSFTFRRILHGPYKCGRYHLVKIFNWLKISARTLIVKQKKNKY